MSLPLRASRACAWLFAVVALGAVALAGFGSVSTGPAWAADSPAPVATAGAASGATATPSPWLTATPPPAPIAGGGLDLPLLPYLLQLVVVTAVVAGLGYVTLRFVKDRVPSLAATPRGKTLRVLEKLALDPNKSVFIVSAGKRYWLLASTPERVTPIAELAEADLATGEFAQLLEQEKLR